MGKPVIWFEVMGKNPKELQDFYSKLFDWKVDANNPIEYGVVDTNSKEGIRGGIAADPEGKTGVMIYIQVKDLKEALDKAESLGGKTVVPPTEIPGMVTYAQFADPEGNLIGLVKE